MPTRSAAKSQAPDAPKTGRQNVWALLAVSSDAQADTIDHQRKWAQETAKQRGWRLTRCVEGVASGKAGPRRVVRELLTALRALEPAQRPGYVLMVRLDRLGRGDVVESQLVLRDLRELGVRVWTREGGEERIDSAMQQLISAAKSAVALYENEVRVDKALAVYKRKRATGLAIGNKRPYGLRLSADGRDEADPERVAVVREAFALRATGVGYHLIGKRLAEIAPAQRFTNGRTITVRWTPSRVVRLLTNRAYVAAGVVDEATFLRVQGVGKRVGPVRPAHFPWPLSGSIRCHCGAAMSGLASGRPDGRIRYYVCRRPGAHETVLRLVRADDLEGQFVELLARLKASPASAARYRQRAAGAGNVHALEKRLAELRADAEKVKRGRERVWELELAGTLRAEDLKERLDALAVRSDEIASHLADVQAQLALATAAAKQNHDADALIARAVRLYERGTDADRRAIARAVALDLGGLCVEDDGKLKVRPIEDRDRQRKRKANEA